jgi:hypothetical protein
MYNTDTEVLFPPRLIAHLAGLRGENWRRLVEAVACDGQGEVYRAAFVLLMVRLNGCLTCHADSYRALRGCTQCATQTVRRFRGTDQELIRLFTEARLEVERYLSESHPEGKGIGIYAKTQ